MKINTLIADDSRIFRKKIVEILQKYPVIQILGEAATGDEAILKAGELIPDLIIMDVRMPDVDGIVATGIIKKNHPEVRIIIASVHDLNEYRMAAEKNGADGYLLKRNVYNMLYPKIADLFHLSWHEGEWCTVNISRLFQDYQLNL